jgi:RNA polymerase sigma factor (sigma-70 family)
MSTEGSQGTRTPADHSAAEAVRLVEAMGTGDREAEQEFVDRYHSRLRAMLLARTRNPDLTGDLVQDVLIEALCALRRGQLREPTKLSAFVIGIARNVLNSHFRGAARQPESIEAPEDLPDLRSSVREIEDRQREAIAMDAISSLEVVDRTILHLTLVDGMKPGAIAERLRLSPDVVRQRKLRATRKIIDFVRGQSQKEPPVYIVTGQKR